MPTYNFSCSECKKKFEIDLSLKEKEDKKITCPNCGSKKIKQGFESFFSNGSSCGGGCSSCPGCHN